MKSKSEIEYLDILGLKKNDYPNLVVIFIDD